jgi:pimeloyl-ACP methyl ester carboxylesterase
MTADMKCPGEMIQCQGKRLHLHVQGNGNPTIILEAGLGCGSESWCAIREPLSKIATVCSYDRAGMMFSEPRKGAPDAYTVAYELHELLANANTQGPYILVGHSIGGIHIRLFAKLFPRLVSALIFVDSIHVDSIHPQHFAYPSIKRYVFEKYQPLCKISSIVKKYPILAASVFKFFSPVIVQYFKRKYIAYTKEYGDEILNAVLANPIRNLLAVSEEVELLVGLLDEAKDTGPFNDIPVVVICGAEGFRENDLPKSFPDPVDELNEFHKKLQRDLLTLSTNSKYVLAKNAGHRIPVEEPDLLVGEVKDLVLRLGFESGC